jgi:hypothetical protein
MVTRSGRNQPVTPKDGGRKGEKIEGKGDGEGVPGLSGITSVNPLRRSGRLIVEVTSNGSRRWPAHDAGVRSG